jgi:hypothetical protein
MSANETTRIRKAFEDYSAGICTFAAVINEVFDCIEVTNVADLMAMMPQEFLHSIRKTVDAAPVTPEDWDRLGLVYIGGPCFFPGTFRVDREEMILREERAKEDFRKRVGILRDYFGRGG